jgi:DNA-binding NarL/FixJ family response regulator
MASSRDTNSRRPSLADVLTVDDQETFREILRHLVELASGLSLVGEADSGERAVDVAKKLEPDMVVMDVVMPGIGGIAAARQIKAERPATVIVLVSTTHPDDLPIEASGSGADEIVWKAELRHGVLESIWRTHEARSGL